MLRVLYKLRFVSFLINENDDDDDGDRYLDDGDSDRRDSMTLELSSGQVFSLLVAISLEVTPTGSRKGLGWTILAS